MASFTQFGGRNMRGTFAGGQAAIVTTDTGRHHTDVTKGGTCPARRGVTHIAGLGGWNMGGGFTRGDNAIVARLTRPQHFSMIHRGDR